MDYFGAMAALSRQDTGKLDSGRIRCLQGDLL
jgi:hypothetical protein